MSKDLRKFLTPKIIAKAVSRNDPLVSTDKLGLLPTEMRPFRHLIPTFMHGKKIQFFDKQSESNNRIRRAAFPNVIYKFVYSRLLDMNIYARITTKTLSNIERRGGFDEYILTSGEGRCNDDKALMYKRLIEAAYAEKGKNLQKEDAELASFYGSDYERAVVDFQTKFSSLKAKKRGNYL